MTFPADRPDPPRHPRRLPAAELERHALGVLRKEPSRRVGLLAVGLGRSDRVRALAQRTDALKVLGEVCDRFESALRPMDRYAVVAVDEIWVMLADAPNEAIVRLAAASLRDRLPEPVRERVSLARDWRASGVRFDVVVVHGDAAAIGATCRELAERPGPIVGIVALAPGDADVPLERLVVERSVSVNTAAAGGNANLMTIG